MIAAVRSKYGPPEVLTLSKLETPTPEDQELLIKIYATTVNRTDCAILWGKPFIMRFFTGLFKPRYAVTGTDFAGQVVKVGKSVKSFNSGERVMGFNPIGCESHAEYLVLPESRANKDTVIIPETQSYEEAAACLEGAFYAVDLINRLKPGAQQSALVNGATGAIGSSMVQILKSYGTYVAAVCGGEHMELVRSLGADRVIDYTAMDFTKDHLKYDYIFDAVGKSTFGKCKSLLKDRGIYTSSEGFQNLLLALITPLFMGKKVIFLPPKDLKAGLNSIKSLIEKGLFRPVIDKKYSLEKIAEAYRYVSAGQKIGNVIIAMEAQPTVDSITT